MKYDEMYKESDKASMISEEISYKSKKKISLGGNAKTLENFFTALSMGMNMKASCEMVGLSYSVVRDWIERGDREVEEGKESDYTEFSKRVKSELAKFQMNNLQVMKEASEERGQWQASAWLLERICPDDYALKRDNTGDKERIVVLSDVKPEK